MVSRMMSLQAPPRSPPPDRFVLVEADHGLHQGIVVGVALAAGGGFDLVRCQSLRSEVPVQMTPRSTSRRNCVLDTPARLRSTELNRPEASSIGGRTRFAARSRSPAYSSTDPVRTRPGVGEQAGRMSPAAHVVSTGIRGLDPGSGHRCRGSATEVRWQEDGESAEGKTGSPRSLLVAHVVDLGAALDERRWLPTLAVRGLRLR